MTAARS